MILKIIVITNIINSDTINKNNMKQKLINLPKDLFKKIEASAKKNARSVNKEIQVLLAQAITTTKNQ